MKILLVEDNEMSSDMLSRRLARRGFEMTIAADGEQALVLSEQQLPDLILMDISLPRLDGWEVTRRLKSSPRTSSIPVIALTAHAMSDDELRAHAVGCDDYDTKPVQLDRLLRKIHGALGSR